MPGRPSLFGRVAVALLLTVGFYVLALAIALALLAVPCFEWLELGAIHIQLALACFVGAGTMFVAVLPQRTPATAPGTRLLPEAQPRLFRFVEEVARACGEAMPSEIYLITDHNAFVTQRKLITTKSPRRVLGIGLAMFQTLTLAQLRGVIAHEFGHFQGGDLRFSRWIYPVRSAILANKPSRSRVVGLFFRAYGRLFLRVTHAISRRQELAADELAIRVAGTEAHVSALERGSAFRPAVGLFWNSQVVPLLELGFQPPLVEGYRRFLAAPGLRALQRDWIANAQDEKKADPYATHPPPRTRIAAARALAPVSVAVANGGAQALGLLVDLPELEDELVDWVMRGAFISRAQAARRLTPIAWDDVPMIALVPSWRRQALLRPAELTNAKVADAPRLLNSIRKSMRTTRNAAALQQAGARALRLSCAVAIALIDAGFELKAPIGEPRLLVRGSSVRNVFSELAAVMDGRTSDEEWRARCVADGVADLPLVPPRRSAAGP